MVEHKDILGLQNKLSIDEFKEDRLAEKLKLTSLETMGKIDSLREEIEFLKEQQPEEAPTRDLEVSEAKRGSPTSSEVLRAINKFVELGLIRRTVIVDNGKEFFSKNLILTLQRQGINILFTAPNSPTSNSIVERRHLSIKSLLYK